MKLIARGQTLVEVKIQRVALTSVIRHRNDATQLCPGGYKFLKSQENFNHFLYLNDIKVFAKN